MSDIFKMSNPLIDLPDIFTGSFVNKNPFIKDLRDEMFDLSRIPGPKNDKVNLRNDLNNFLKDTRKAQEKIKGKNH